MTDAAVNRKTLTFAKLLGYKSSFPKALLGFSYNDRPLGDVELIHASPLRLCKRSNELLIVSLALAFVEQKHAAIDDRIDGMEAKAEAPDFAVTLDNKRVIGVEVAQITGKNAAAADNLLEKLAFNVNKFFRTNTLPEYFALRSMSLQLSVTNQRGFNSRKLIEEIVDLALAACSANRPTGAMIFPDPSRQPLLKTYKCHGQITLRGHSPISLTPDPFANRAATPRIHVSGLIEQKRGLKYREVGDGLWLALGVTDPMGQFSFNIEEFSGNTFDMPPFERIVITDGVRAVYNEQADKLILRGCLRGDG